MGFRRSLVRIQSPRRERGSGESRGLFLFPPYSQALTLLGGAVPGIAGERLCHHPIPVVKRSPGLRGTTFSPPLVPQTFRLNDFSGKAIGKFGGFGRFQGL